MPHANLRLQRRSPSRNCQPPLGLLAEFQLSSKSALRYENKLHNSSASQKKNTLPGQAQRQGGLGASSKPDINNCYF